MIAYQSRGFTIIEAVITVLIAAIFLAAAVPSYYALIQNNKVAMTTNKLSAAFNMARMEAVKRGVKVTVCSAANSSLSSCGTTTQWVNGWIIFTDANNNDTIDSNNDLTYVSEAVPKGVAITASRKNVGYNSAGFLSGSALIIVIKAPGCTGNNARQISISTSGRVSVLRAAC